MKTKFIAIAALALWLAVTGWLATMVIVKPAALHLSNDADETAAMVELRGAIARNQQMQQRIAQLRQATFPGAGSGQPLLALPSATASGNEAGNLPAHASSAEPVAHSVSLVLEANGRRSAIIDGRHVHAGARLEDGSRVAAIGTNWVRIDGPDGERLLHPVPSPYQAPSGAAR